MKIVRFAVEEELFQRWNLVTEKMRWGEKSRLMRQLLSAVVREMEQGRRVRLAEIKVRRHSV